MGKPEYQSDIISQKQSDATMGFERVMDTETNEIYQTDDGLYRLSG